MYLRMRPCILLVAAALLTGCGKEERTEGVRLTRVLTERQANFDRANTLERDFVSSARAWCDGITINGAGRGVDLDQNARIATVLAKSAVAISTQLSQVRQAVYGESLKEAYPQSVRADLITQLTKRQRLLQDMRAALEQSAPQFLDYRQSKTYAGDTYPGGIGELDALLKAYKPPEDIVGSAVAGLKAKYKLTPKDL
jgi:hypothetical protein